MYSIAVSSGTFNLASNTQYTLSIGSIYQQSPGGAYVCTFNESMLLPWVGVECLVQHRLATVYSISVKVIDGSNPFESSHTTVFTCSKVPLPLVVMNLSIFMRLSLQTELIQEQTLIHVYTMNIVLKLLRGLMSCVALCWLTQR